MKKLFLLLFTEILLISCLYAQMTNTQVVEYVKNADAQGIDQVEIARQLSKKGVTESQLLEIKNNYSQSKDIQTEEKTVVDERKRIWNNDLEQKVITPQQDLIFGHSFFCSKYLTFEPNLFIPTPKGYKLGVGDEVIIDVWGDSEENIVQTISPEGAIFISGVGPIYLTDLNIDDAEKHIKKYLGRKYSDLLSARPRTFLKLSLGRIRSIRVHVTGEVAVPGTYTLPSLATLFHALYTAGGVNMEGSLRNIELFRNGVKVSEIDVYEYLLKEGVKDVSLQDGDNIRVNVYGNRVKIEGEVKRPKIYELIEGESLATLLYYGGGFADKAYKKYVTVRRKDTIEHKIFTVSKDSFSSFIPEDGDEIIVSPILDKYENKIRIEGAVYRPGDYALDDRTETVSKLITMAEGLRGDAHLQHALIYRELPNLTNKVIALDLTIDTNIQLQRNDILIVPSGNDIHETYTIGIFGEVMNPDMYNYMGNMTLGDAILRAGGLREAASIVRIDIAHRVKSVSAISESQNLAQLLTLSLADTAYRLQPFDYIFIRRSPAYHSQQTVEIRGEVLYPGVYALEYSDERLSDLIQRAGGMASQAYIGGARLVRKMDEAEKAKQEAITRIIKNTTDTIMPLSMLDTDKYSVGISLTKALRRPGSDADVVLREGDELYIPRYNGTVKISGAVMYPNAVSYSSGKSFKRYIENGGGYALGAKRKRVYVVYMNGTVATRKGSHKLRIEPGCEIVVPMRRPGMDLAQIMGVTNSSVSLAALVATIINLTR